MGRPVHDFFVAEAHRVLTMYALAMEVRFTVGPMPFAADDIFSPEGFLPLIALRADERMREHSITMTGAERQALARGLGLRLQPNPDALLGQTVEIATLDRLIDPLSTVRLLYLAEASDTILGLETGAQIDCLPLLEKFAPPQNRNPNRTVKWPLTKPHSPQ